MAEVILGDLYSLNKQAMNKIKPLSQHLLHKDIKEMIHDIYSSRNPYWMLLCRERNDFTVFILITERGSYNEMIPTLMNRGDVLSIEKQPDNNYEIWIRDPETKENFAYYLFDYSEGIVKA